MSRTIFASLFFPLSLFAVACGAPAEGDVGSGAGAQRGAVSPASTPHCGPTALEAAAFVDGLGWGTVDGEPLALQSAVLDGDVEVAKIRSAVSATTYEVKTRYFAKQDACVVFSMTTGAPLRTLSGTDEDVRCADTGLRAASKVDELGWGTFESAPPKIVSRKREEATGTEEVAVASTVSGSTYRVQLLQDARSGSCVVLGIAEL